MSGPVILMAAALMPERVVGVVPVDTLHDIEFQWPEGIFEAFELQMKTNFAGFMNQFVSSSLNPDVDDAVKQGIIDDAQDNDSEVAWEIFQEFETMDIPKIVSDCPVPMHSINSAVLETKFETNRKYNADFDAEIIANSGHWVMLEQPEAFNAALRTVLDEMLGKSD
jgi:pimeloyl-ACP methyl ester carboxylesterase